MIRRNLVYAVGLPPMSSTEDILRKAEHFGQYGRIAKIVINRSQIGTGPPGRSSASAYVTFQHKEDTLACILALDGFWTDGRNVRASYGTSKYCSAFIKNVRCNNPECTYLHYMGDAEDTFNKQEVSERSGAELVTTSVRVRVRVRTRTVQKSVQKRIRATTNPIHPLRSAQIQAGYVTSGRDVLAKMQANAVGVQRKLVGGGGPSRTGKASERSERALRKTRIRATTKLTLFHSKHSFCSLASPMLHYY